jgi:hypothetical protein
LAEDEKDERRVEEILTSSHAAIIRRQPFRVVGARVEPGLIYHSTPGLCATSAQTRPDGQCLGVSVSRTNRG